LRTPRGYSIAVLDKGQDLRVMRELLQAQGFHIRVFQSAHSAFAKWIASPPSMIIVEPDVLGTEAPDLCRQIRENSTTSLIPIIFVSRQSEEADKVVALGQGQTTIFANHLATASYLPGSSLRRCYELREPAVLRFGELEINSQATTLTVGGLQKQLNPSEFRLLDYMAHNPGRTFTREQLLKVTRFRKRLVKPKLVDTTVNRIRKVIEKDPADPQFIRTVNGFGYRFNDPSQGKQELRGQAPDILDALAEITVTSDLIDHSTKYLSKSPRNGDHAGQ